MNTTSTTQADRDLDELYEPEADVEDATRNLSGDEAFCDACCEYHTDTNRDHPVKWLG